MVYNCFTSALPVVMVMSLKYFIMSFFVISDHSNLSQVYIQQIIIYGTLIKWLKVVVQVLFHPYVSQNNFPHQENS